MTNCGKVFFVILSLVSSYAIAEISRPSQLSCDFSSDFCNWRNLVAIDQQDWFRDERIVSDPFNSIPRGVNGLGDVFAYVRGGQGLQQEALLASDAILCQRSQGMVAFALWKSSIPPSLEVCIRQPPNAGGKIRCLARFEGHVATDWVARFVVIPPNPKPFQIIFRATFSNPFDVIGIDKIVYDADQLCRPELSFTESLRRMKLLEGFSEHSKKKVEEQQSLVHSQQFQQTHEPIISEYRRSPSRSPFKEERQRLRQQALIELPQNRTNLRKCLSFQCGFENEMCDLEAYSLQAPASYFRYVCLPIGEEEGRFLKPPQGRCFLVATTTRDIPLTLVIASRTVFVPYNTNLRFSYSLPSSGDTTLMVCVNSLHNCIWKASKPKRNLQHWWHQRLQLESGPLQIFFVIEQNKRGTWMGLDDVRLVPVSNERQLADCQIM